ncbi:UNVERIFIED_ORG: NAD(P)-dependent dehydrogenase (short-subunit alcohol dehydrogenase family) [Xanthobacter viscosus]|jgi:NAD(P)-dependent dehydrogenase (short-subunit alcohol dehydrogenase family)|uniref:SDR family oxidoreductase n=1 Tax=Xanthobacter autotrophicus TaxID=280 RepID=A0A6C1KUV7_XANAU|nr:SDR family NAD(P)-dependent oxidoreductase [Xanthobacter autotrophicus]TLX43013.1 SDR family oxidoreductase [Xanthobacter autotrophicus]
MSGEPGTKSPFRLDGKVVLVTGCGSIGPGWGNGKAISVLFARQGARVFGVDLNLDAADETRGIVEGEGGEMAVRAGDVTSSTDTSAMVQACLDRFGRIDVLVNNVGRSEPGDPATMDEEVWDAQLDVNLKSAYLMLKSVLPLMVEQGGGSVVNISSVAGLRYVGKPQVAYAAGKAGLMQMTRTTAVIYAPKAVRLNCVVPGLIHTPLVARLADKYAAGRYEEFVATRNAQVPMGRMGDGWDVAHAALFLAADESRYVTGAELVVDGGLTSATG